MQSAFQIQVSKSDDSFKESSMVWDTGKFNSDESIHIEYAGTQLESRTRYYYRIKVWDNKGNTQLAFS